MTTISGAVGGNGGYGGGIHTASGFISGTMVSNNSTISSNVSKTNGGGIYPISGTVTIKNTLLAGNSTEAGFSDCIYSIISDGYNLIGNTSGCNVTATSGDQFNINPMLGIFLPQLGFHPILLGSPAIDAGNSASCLPTDQRGLARVGNCDIGAFEYMTPNDAVNLSLVSGDGQRAAPALAFDNSLKVISWDIEGNPVPDVSVTFTAPMSGASEILRRYRNQYNIYSHR